MLIKYMVYITFGFKNNQGQVNIRVCISYSVNSNAHTTPVIIYGEPDAHKFCAVDIFWNISRRQAILPVAKFHHVVLLISGWCWFLSNVSQPIRINNFTCKYNITSFHINTIWQVVILSPSKFKIYNMTKNTVSVTISLILTIQWIYAIVH